MFSQNPPDFSFPSQVVLAVVFASAQAGIIAPYAGLAGIAAPYGLAAAPALGYANAYGYANVAANIAPVAYNTAPIAAPIAAPVAPIAAPVAPIAAQYALPAPRVVEEPAIVEQAVTPVEQHGYSIAY